MDQPLINKTNFPLGHPHGHRVLPGRHSLHLQTCGAGLVLLLIIPSATVRLQS